MAELGDKPAAFPDDYFWASGPGANPVTDPGTGLRQSGSAFEAELAAAHWNWLQQQQMLVGQWQGNVIARSFEAVEQGVIAMEAPFRFRVARGDTGEMSYIGQSQYTVTQPGGVVQVVDMAADCRQLYVAQLGYVYVATPATGAIDTSVWTDGRYGGSGAAISHICADGVWLFVLDSGLATIQQVDAVTGVLENVISVVTLTSPVACESNGIYLAVADGTWLRVITDLDTTPTLEGSYQHDTSATLRDIAIDHNAAYIGGNRATNDPNEPDIQKIPLASPNTRIWWQQFNSTSPAVINSIQTDGRYVYVGIDRDAVDGTQTSILCLDATTGITLWTYDTSYDVDQLLLDGELLWAFEGGTGAVCLHLRERGVVALTAALAPWCTDGHLVYGIGSTNTQIVAIHHGGPAKTFMRTVGVDPNRAPYHGLSIPEDHGK
jgi:hypothetical protein